MSEANKPAIVSLPLGPLDKDNAFLEAGKKRGGREGKKKRNEKRIYSIL